MPTVHFHFSDAFMRAYFADWNESQHKRDKGGKFAEQAGGGGNTKTEQKSKTAQSNQSNPSGAGTLPPPERLKSVALIWSADDTSEMNIGDWTAIGHAARHAVSGRDPADYVCYDCPGDDQARLRFATEVIKAVEAAPIVAKPLYRGIVVARNKLYKIGDTFSESLASWTGKSTLAENFIDGHYDNAPPWEKDPQRVLLSVEGSEMKGLPLSEHLPTSASAPLREADEYLTSGQYRVTASQKVGDVYHLKVTRVGKATGKAEI